MTKTITLKADERFDEMLSRLAERTHRSKSAVIREAVAQYQKQLDREALRRRLRVASLKTRAQAVKESERLDDVTSDGL
jgi:predicted transcriptional regulator